MVGFVMNVQVPYLVPTTVDGYSIIPAVGDGRSVHSSMIPSLPLLNNLLLLIGFGLQHRSAVCSAILHPSSVAFACKGVARATPLDLQHQ